MATSVLGTFALNLGLNHSGFSHADVRSRLAVGAALVVAYRIGCVALWGRTLGYRLVRTRVVPARQPAARTPGWARSFVRGIAVYGPSFLVLPVPPGAAREVLGWAAAGWQVAAVLAIVVTRDRTGLHDKLSGTLVVLEPGTRVRRLRAWAPS